jgi:hypothetical protein
MLNLNRTHPGSDLRGMALSQEEIAEIEDRFEALKPYQQSGSPSFAAAVP